MKIYIAGPMTGIRDFNFPEFRKMEKWMEGWGIDYISPVDMDSDYGLIFTKEEMATGRMSANKSLDSIIRRDVGAILECTGIVMLKGWEDSRGAMAEWHVARWAGRNMFYEATIATIVAKNWVN